MAGLLLLAVVPVIAGMMRLAELTGGAEITPDNARYFASPNPVVAHIVSVTIYCVLGAFQFSGANRRRNIGWHRMSGRFLVPMGLIAALSGVWMSQFYPPMPTDTQALHVIRWIVGGAMTAAILLGLFAVLRRDIANHRA